MTKTLEEKMKTVVGYCTSCGVEIIDLSLKKPKLLKNYAEHEIELSNETIMPVGVCADCKLKLISGNEVQKIADKILSNHKTYWSGKNGKERPKDWDKLTVTDPNTSYEKWYKKKILKNHSDKIERIKKLK